MSVLHTLNGILLVIKVKIMFTLEQAMKAQRESTGIALHFL
jgi:hypothetical protein